MEKVATGVKDLSVRQKEILRLIAQHHQAKEVARILNITEHTVKAHTETARRRLGVATSREAARILTAHERLMQNEGWEALPREGGYPPRGMADSTSGPAGWGHEQALFSEQPVLSGELEPAGNSLAHAGLTREAAVHRRHAGYAPEDGDNRRSGEGRLHDDRGYSVADRRWGRFERRLEGLKLWQWFGLVVLIGILLPMVTGVLIQAALVMFEAIHDFKRAAG